MKEHCFVCYTWDERLKLVDESQKGLKSHLVVGGKEVLDDLNFGWDGLHTLWGEHCIMEVYIRLPYSALTAIEHYSILWCILDKVNKLPAMLLWGPAIDANVMFCDDAW